MFTLYCFLILVAVLSVHHSSATIQGSVEGEPSNRPRFAMSAIPEPFGQRLLPNILKEEADANPERVFAVYTNSDSDDLTKDSFVEVTFRQIKQAVDHVANWLQSTFDHDEKLAQHETLAFIGIPDLRYNIFFYAALQCRCKVCSIDRSIVILTEQPYLTCSLLPGLSPFASESSIREPFSHEAAGLHKGFLHGRSCTHS